MDRRFSFTTFDSADAPLGELSYAQLLAQVSAAQAKTETAQCQSQIGTVGNRAKSVHFCSFHAMTAKLLSGAQHI